MRILKRKGLHSRDPSSYRPLGMLGTAEKLYERMILKRTHRDLTNGSVLKFRIVKIKAWISKASMEKRYIYVLYKYNTYIYTYTQTFCKKIHISTQSENIKIIEISESKKFHGYKVFSFRKQNMKKIITTLILAIKFFFFYMSILRSDFRLANIIYIKIYIFT